MTEQVAFKPNLKYVSWGRTIPSTGEEIEVTPSAYDPRVNNLIPTGEPVFKATVIGVGDVGGTICLSRSAENCAQCPFPRDLCKASVGPFVGKI